MADLITTQALHAENRSWLSGPHGTGPGDNPSVTLLVSAFTKADHYPDGVIPSGTVLARAANGTYGPYTGGGGDLVLLFGSLPVPDGATRLAAAGLVHGFVDPARLPRPDGASGGLDADARTALRLIHFAPGA